MPRDEIDLPCKALRLEASGVRRLWSARKLLQKSSCFPNSAEEQLRPASQSRKDCLRSPQRRARQWSRHVRSLAAARPDESAFLLFPAMAYTSQGRLRLLRDSYGGG